MATKNVLDIRAILECKHGIKLNMFGDTIGLTEKTNSQMTRMPRFTAWRD